MTVKELKEKLKLHKIWLQDHKKGERLNLSHKDLRRPSLNELLKFADLSDADLSYTYLCGANLHNAILTNANLTCADLSCTNLRGACLRNANLTCADLYEADLIRADLYKANLVGTKLYGANLRNAYLHSTNLDGVNLYGVNLYGADLRNAYNIPPIRLACPDTGSFIGWKKVQNYIIKLRIPSKAKRCSTTTNKCRCEYAKVLEIQNLDGSKAAVNEVFNNNYAGCTYQIGEIVYPDSFDENRWNECSNGIHFFINRQEAVDY